MTAAVHGWICGRCGTLVRATVGTILQAFAAHVAQCPVLLQRRRVDPAHPPTPQRKGAP